MRAVLVVFVATLLIGWRWGRTVWPGLKRLGSLGDELGGWTLFFTAGGARATKNGISAGAKVLGWIMLVIAAIFSPFLRLALFCLIIWRGRKMYVRMAERRRELSAGGFACAAERDLIAEATRSAMLSMGLGSKSGDELVPPHCWGWRRLPVTVGGRAIKGAYRYECRVEPAPGKGVASIMERAGRGLDADDDLFRDAINSSLRAARGKKAQQAKAALGGRLPQFTLSTVEQSTRKGEKIGVCRLALWSTDPFRRPVNYPYSPAEPRVKSFADRVPVGLKRGNAEALMMLDRHTSIQGINGSGKSSIVRPALIAAAHTDALIGVMAMKGPHDYADMAARFIGGRVVVEKTAVMSVLRWANTEIQRRNALNAEERAALPHIMLVLDEGQELEDDISLIVPIVKKGRSAKVWLWSVTQYGLSSIIPSEAAREMGQRYAGRIEGGVTQAQVAVGGRAGKQAGPHLIPDDPRWTGVLFGSDGQYLRAYWVSAEALPGEPPSDLALCAAALGPRPDDPEGYTRAAETVEPLAALPVAKVDDGVQRIASGEVTAIDFRPTSALPDEIRDAFAAVFAAAGERMPSTRKQIDKVTPALDRAAETVPVEVATIELFLSTGRSPVDA